ncbi:hypothetical protein RJ641_008475 [Dillenia turbinata]|uniref:Uncharacterized protein n=1 Tax=Dillenia turbinata TaxID=194707 RepID=A0AAN8VAV9_9MAGN
MYPLDPSNCIAPLFFLFNSLSSSSSPSSSSSSTISPTDLNHCCCECNRDRKRDLKRPAFSTSKSKVL